MKKSLVLVFAAFALVGCGNGAGQKTTKTVCAIDKPYKVYSSAKQTITSEGDIAKKIDFEGILKASDKESLEAALPQLDAAVTTVNALEGVSARYEKVDDITLKDIASYDLEKASLQTLIQLGLLESTDDENAKLISVEQSVKGLEDQGFTCSVE
ncbi:YehR family protein [Granulicatella seriolae]|uniref:YehR family protein n=1 Tax=Granulicatella seriolae TaxID=2967226 RepID=A0ABT1WP11_9LACT|nr:YehR family protein [Granulicatella seriolae]